MALPAIVKPAYLYNHETSAIACDDASSLCAAEPIDDPARVTCTA